MKINNPIVIAEIGVNHNGNFKLLNHLISNCPLAINLEGVRVCITELVSSSSCANKGAANTPINNSINNFIVFRLK